MPRSQVVLPALQVLSHTLDLYAERGTLFLERFTLYSAAQRVRGGQGIVQFARETTSGRECAVKFFTHRGAFERERELYHSPALRGQMAAVIHLEGNADARLLMAPGWPFPPCIVVEVRPQPCARAVLMLRSCCARAEVMPRCRVGL